MYWTHSFFRRPFTKGVDITQESWILLTFGVFSLVARITARDGRGGRTSMHVAVGGVGSINRRDTTVGNELSEAQVCLSEMAIWLHPS